MNYSSIRKTNSIPGLSRRQLISHSFLGLAALGLPFSLEAARPLAGNIQPPSPEPGFPSIPLNLVSELVGASHFNLDRVREIVTERPEMARASWDWGFGDWETALGAASHVGRRDIALFLLEHGARPDIFTFAMLGHVNTVKEMIAARPGIQTTPGPHGISLLDHARAGLRMENDMSPAQRSQSQELISYLEKLGDADPRQIHIEMTDEEKARYLGDYMYGQGKEDGLSVQLNRRNLMSLGKLGKFGGALYQVKPGVFEYNGIRSVQITFDETGGKVQAMNITHAGNVIKAQKTS